MSNTAMPAMIRLLVFATVLFLLPVAGVCGGAEQALNIDESGIALGGFDPVSYFRQGPEKGAAELSASHAGATYLFASRDNLAAFQQDPEAYVPAYGGWCAWAMLDGEKVEIDPATYTVVDGVNYLFYNSFFVNTLKRWNERAGEESEAALIERADAQWRAIEDRE